MPKVLIATLLTCLITALTILVHYEAIRFVHRWHARPWNSVRFSVIAGVFLLFAAHSFEIWLFAAGIYIAKNVLLLGGLEGAFTESTADYLYISVVTYAAIGYGDIRPTGFIRTMCGFEALTGILMMAWSAAYTVSRLQDLWHQGGE